MLSVLEEGNFFDVGPNLVTAIRGLRLTSANRIFKRLVPYLKAPHELLPSEAYFQLGGLPFSERFDFNGDSQITTYNYPTIRSTVNSRYPTLPYETNRLFHSVLQDDWRNDTSDVEYFHLFGRQIEENTPEQIIAKRRLRGPRIVSNSGIKFEVKRGIGDKTVPALSAERIGNGTNLNASGVVPQAFIPESALGEDDEDVEHNGLTKNSRVQQRIFEILGLTSQPVVGSLSLQGKEKKVSSELNGIPQRETNYLLVEGVERLTITDDLGNTNTQINEDFELKVPNVSYTPLYIEGTPNGWYSHDVAMTTLRQYTIKFRTGTDVVDIELIRGIANDSPNYLVRYNDLQLPANVECLLTINAQGMDDLRYDSNNDGTYDTVVPAHVRVSGTAAQDVTAPNVSIDFSRGGGGMRRVTINATDSETGVRTIYYRIGETGNFQIYTESFVIPPNAGNTVEAFADDNVGNRSSPVRATVPNNLRVR